MTITEANQVIHLLRHLDGTDPRPTETLVDDALALAERAGRALQLTITLDAAALADALGPASCCGALGFGDFGDDLDGYVLTRPIVDVHVAGDRL